MRVFQQRMADNRRQWKRGCAPAEKSEFHHRGTETRRASPMARPPKPDAHSGSRHFWSQTSGDTSVAAPSIVIAQPGSEKVGLLRVDASPSRSIAPGRFTTARRLT
jgi:hypothetical protein